MSLHTLIAGILLGISFCAPVGPVTIETLRRGLAGGFRPALALQLGSLIGDTTFCVLAFLGLAPLITHNLVRIPLWVGGAGVLAYLGISALRDALAGFDFKSVEYAALGPQPSALTSAFRTGAAMSLTNPMAILWWVSIGGAMLASGITDVTPAGTTAFIVSFVLGCTLYAFFMAALMGVGRQFVRPSVFRMATALSGLALLVFGGQIGWQALTTLVAFIR
ncbi:MAG: LysE family transporter [Anaerolineae bacterium]|nr:LysE family transporter [Anaerolineae bacterium]